MPTSGAPGPRPPAREEEVRPVADLVADRVLQQAVRDRHGGAEQVAAGPDHWRTVWPRCRMTLRSRCATAGQAVQTWSLRGDRAGAWSTNARYVAAIVSRTRSPGRPGWARTPPRDRIALELDEGEGRSEAHDHGVEQRPEHRVRRRDPGAEVGAVFQLDPGHEAGVAGDIGEQQVSLGGRRIRRGAARFGDRVDPCDSRCPVLVRTPVLVLLGRCQRGSGFGPVASQPLGHPVVDVVEPVVERTLEELDGCPQ